MSHSGSFFSAKLLPNHFRNAFQKRKSPHRRGLHYRHGRWLKSWGEQSVAPSQAVRHHFGRLSPRMVQLFGVSRRIVSVAWFAPETWTLMDLVMGICISCSQNSSETGPEKGGAAAGARKASAAGSLSLSRVGALNAAGSARFPEGFPSPG